MDSLNQQFVIGVYKSDLTNLEVQQVSNRSQSNVGQNTQEFSRARLIINPVSGDEQPNLMKLPEIVAALKIEGIRADIAFTEPDNSPTQIAQTAVEEGYNLVIVAGGDGTVAEVAKGLIYAPIPLGIIPVGTYNNIARSLNIPTELVAACQVIARGQIKQIDVGQANNKHYFFEAAGVGLDAVLFPLGAEIKDGRWGRILQAVQLALAYQPQKFIVEFDRTIIEARQHHRWKLKSLRQKALGKRELQLEALLVVVANGPYYGTGFTVAPDAVIDDGLLTISVFRNFSKWEILRHFWSISRGQYCYSPKIETYHAAQVKITSQGNLAVHIDGHAIGELPVTLKALKHTLTVIVPQEAMPA